MKKSPIVLFLLFALSAGSAAGSQTTGSLRGTVRDEKTKAPLMGVNIFLKNTVLGTTTNLRGEFILERIPAGAYTVAVSHIGYKTRELPNADIRIAETTRIEVLLEETLIAVNPIVVTAGKHPQSLDATHQAVVAVGRARLVERQVGGLDESLHAVPGIHFNESNISIRGSSGYSLFNIGSRIHFLIDGIPSITPDLNAINWEMLSLYDVDRIEVIKGAGSALYGSSAIGGVINLITRAPSQRGRLQIRTRAGIYDKPHYPEWRWTDDLLYFEGVDLNYSRTLGPLGFHLSASQYESTGYMQNNAAHQWNIGGRFTLRLPLRSRLDLHISWMENSQEWFLAWLSQNSPFKVPEYDLGDGFEYQTINVYARYSLPVSATFGIRLRVSHMTSKIGGHVIGAGSGVYDPQAWKPGLGLGWEIQADWFPHRNHHIILGHEMTWDASGSKFFGDHTGHTLSPYIQDEWTVLPGVIATLGCRYDAHVLNDETTDTHLSPKFGINVKPSESTSVRASLGSGFRAATVFEKYIEADHSGFTIIPNPDLRPESAWSWDIGIRQSFGEYHHVECSFFQSDYEDMIEPVINFLGTIQYQNFVRARIRGVECFAESWHWRRRLGLRGSLTWMDPENLKTGETLPYRPRFSGNVEAILKLGDFRLSAEYQYASRIENVEIRPLDPRVPTKLAHIRAEYAWREFRVQVAVTNLLNYHYTQVEQRMAEVRKYTLSLLFDTGK